MQTKTLHTIQTLCNLGRILSKIVFIFSLIGAIACAAGALSIKLLPEPLQFGSVTIQGLVDLTDEIGPNEAFAALIVGAISLAAEAILSKLAERYFRNERKAGTPFTFAGAKQLIRLGVCAIVIPIASAVAVEIVHSVLEHYLTGVSSLDLADSASVGLGVMMIVAGLLCRHGAELAQGQEA